VRVLPLQVMCCVCPGAKVSPPLSNVGSGNAGTTDRGGGSCTNCQGQGGQPMQHASSAGLSASQQTQKPRGSIDVWI
jgi:hypothetical protein